MPDRILTPIKAIRAKCLDCSCGQIAEVRNCLIPTCPLYPYRMGKRPKCSRIDSPQKISGLSQDLNTNSPAEGKSSQAKSLG